MNKIIAFIIALSFIIYSCESDETKKKRAKEVVSSFITNMNFENYDETKKIYPNFQKIRSYYKLKDFTLESPIIDGDKINIVASTKQNQVLFIVENGNNFTIQKTKGLYSEFNSNLYKFCKNIGCITESSYDIEISEACENQRDIFKTAVNLVKEDIEKNVKVQNNNIEINFGSASGEISLRNNSNYTIPGFAYNIYINYTDSRGRVLLTSKENFNYDAIPYNQSKSIRIFESNAGDFERVNDNLKLTQTYFIEKIIAENAKGANCKMSEL